MTKSSIQFVHETARGVVIRTFEDEALARKWFAERRAEFPGSELYEVETVVSVTRTKLGARRKPALRVVA